MASGVSHQMGFTKFDRFIVRDHEYFPATVLDVNPHERDEIPVACFN
jgi:hypothetical protein